MDLDTIEAVLQPRTRDELPAPLAGDAFLAGGTALLSEPQPHLRRLVDLASLGWTPVETTDAGLRIAATCTLERFGALEPVPAWPALALCAATADALWGSFKIHKAATIGGNLCHALPAAPVAAFAVALDGICEIWCPDGSTRTLPALHFVTGDGCNALATGELLRAVFFPDVALRRRVAFRQASLTEYGRSGALVIATRDDAGWALAITAAVRRPVRVAFGAAPASDALHAAIDAAIPDALLHDDVHGSPAWRRHMTHRLAADALEALS